MRMPTSKNHDLSQKNWMKNYGVWQNVRLRTEKVRLRLVTESEIWPKSKFGVFLQVESESGNAPILSWQMSIAQDDNAISEQRYLAKVFDRENRTLGQWLNRKNCSKMINPEVMII